MLKEGESSSEIKNASQYPRVFYARHMQPGICGYDNETILVDTDAVKKLAKSGVGIPVYIHHQDVDLKTMKEKASGYVSDSFYNELDGWGWFKFLAIDDECAEAIRQGWKVSNAYCPSEWAGGGTKNNCEYNREVINGAYTHLAIVPNPRYESACIKTPDEFQVYQEHLKAQLEELKNSKADPSKGTLMFKMFKNKREEVSAVDADTHVELENGKSISIGEMINAVKKNAEGEKKEMANADSMVDVEGESMPVSELVNRYKNSLKKNEKKNAEGGKGEEKKGDEEDRKDEDKENAEDDKKDEEKLKKEEKKEEKTNSHFEDLRNANTKGAGVQIIETSIDQVQRGAQRYGSQK